MHLCCVHSQFPSHLLSVQVYARVFTLSQSYALRALSICEVVIGGAQTLACKNPPRIHEASLNARNKPPKSRYKKISSAQLTEVEDSVCNFNFHSLSSIN